MLPAIRWRRSMALPMERQARRSAGLFNETIGQAASAVNNLNKLYIAAAAQNTSSASSFDLNQALYSPTWPSGNKNPRVAQFQRGAATPTAQTGWCLPAEYVFVHGYEFPLVEDDNHLGAANSASFDPAAAAAAITAGNASVGCPPGSAGIDCAIAAGATIATYGAYGLGAGSAATGYAFRGKKRCLRSHELLRSQGFEHLQRSKSSAGWKVRRTGCARLFVDERQHGHVCLHAFTQQGQSQDLRILSRRCPLRRRVHGDSLQPTRFVGPDGLDRTSMLNAGTITDIKKGFVFSQITHWYSPLSNNALLPTAFRRLRRRAPKKSSVVTGRAMAPRGDFLPTAGPGAFGRSPERGQGPELGDQQIQHQLRRADDARRQAGARAGIAQRAAVNAAEWSDAGAAAGAAERGRSRSAAAD